MKYEAPEIKDLGSITDHTFTNSGLVPGMGPKGKNPDTTLVNDKFDEPSHS